MQNITRNQPCPCGSTKKYKHCCGLLSAAPESKMLERTVGMKRARDAAFERVHGKGRPMVTAASPGYRFVAVGDSIHWAQTERIKSFPDFLTEYLKELLGRHWGNAELKKWFTDRHEILRWYDAASRYEQSLERNAAGVFVAPATGALWCWYRLAYDLYLIKHNAELQRKILERLRDKRQFQGARFELTVAASMTVAGFSIRYEDERDGSRRHPEFRATTDKGFSVAIEAKSRHRDGALGFLSPGAKVSDQVLVDGILRDALAKNPGMPYIVIVDVNLPPRADFVSGSHPWFRELAETARLLQSEYDADTFPANALIFYNDSSHYALDVVTASSPWCYVVVAERPRFPLPATSICEAIGLALRQRANIPTAITFE